MPRTIERAARQVRQFICGLHGHDALLHFDHRHVSLVCVLCGHESTGWNLPGSGKPAASAPHLSARTSGAAGRAA